MSEDNIDNIKKIAYKDGYQDGQRILVADGWTSKELMQRIKDNAFMEGQRCERTAFIIDKKNLERDLEAKKRQCEQLEKMLYFCKEAQLPEHLFNFMLSMVETLNKHQERKGDSWKSCEMRFLRNKLEEEVCEWRQAHNMHYENKLDARNENQELIDIANITMMLWNRNQVYI